MIPQTGQKFIATLLPRLKNKSHTGRTGNSAKDIWFLEWETFQPVTYTIVSQQIIDNDTDREITLLREDGIITEVERNWFDTKLTGRKIELVN